MLYYLSEHVNTNPKTVEEINTRIMIIIPNISWVRVCQNNKFTKGKNNQLKSIKYHFSDISDERAEFSLVSIAYSNRDERIKAYKYLMEDAHNDLDAVLELIEKNKNYEKLSVNTYKQLNMKLSIIFKNSV